MSAQQQEEIAKIKREANGVMRTPTQWEEITGVKIHDSDGWKIDNQSFDTPITKEEWDYRMQRSTTMGQKTHALALTLQNRRNMWMELEMIQEQVTALKALLQEPTTRVIPWESLRILAESTALLLYSAGDVNALRLVKGNAAVPPGECEREVTPELPVAVSKPAEVAHGSTICELLKEAADSIHASLAEDGISDSRRQYRKDLEQRLRNAISPNNTKCE